MVVVLPSMATCAGMVRAVREPTPSWPKSLPPAQKTSPSRSRWQMCVSPPTTCAAGARPSISVGLAVKNPEVPSPNWPDWLFPQHQTVAAGVIAQVCVSPRPRAATAGNGPDTLGSSLIGLPVNDTPVGIAAIWPNALSPQHQISPSPRRAQVCEALAAISSAAHGSTSGAGAASGAVTPAS